MIVFDLKCQKDHVFEAWFKDSKAFDTQSKAGKVVCPICGNKKVAKALMAPNIVGAKQKAGAEADIQAKVMQVLAQLRDQVEKNCDYVGDKFADEARKIHYGETDKRGIYGEASDEEAEALAEEGIEFGRLPWLPRTDG